MHLPEIFPQRIHKIFIILALIFWCPSGVWANVYVDGPSVTLSWAQNPEDDLQGYEVYAYDALSDSETAYSGIVTALSWTDTSVSYDDIRYYRLRAIDTVGNLSDFSAPSDVVIISDGDFDGDGYTDAFEEIMGTDPLDRDSRPSATSLDLSPSTAQIGVGGNVRLNVRGIFDLPVGAPTDYDMTCLVEYKTSIPGIVSVNSCGNVVGLSEGTTSIWAEQILGGQTIAASNVAVATVLAVPSKVGVFREGYWYFDVNGDGAWNAGDEWLAFGMAGDSPIVGDFNGDGADEIGVFRDGYWYLDSNDNGLWDAGDRLIGFGMAGDSPVVGDFNGDGADEIGVFRDGYWYLDSNDNGAWNAGDEWLAFGMAGDSPIVGDFNGDGMDEIGVFRDGYWYLDSNDNGLWDAGDRLIGFGLETFVPVVGKW